MVGGSVDVGNRLAGRPISLVAVSMDFWLPYAFNTGLVLALLIYRAFKRFPKERFESWRGWLDANMVELILGAMLVPDVARLAVQYFLEQSGR